MKRRKRLTTWLDDMNLSYEQKVFVVELVHQSGPKTEWNDQDLKDSLRELEDGEVERLILEKTEINED